MFKRLTLVLVLVLSAAVAAATTSRDADSAATALERHAHAVRLLRRRAGATATPRGRSPSSALLRAGVVRTTLDWRAVARRRPVKPTDPADPAYNWTAVDRVVDEADKKGIRVVLAIYGTPRWAGPRPEPGPAPRDRPPVVRDRRREALQRHVHGQGAGERAGAHAAGRPDWLAWNEPNNPVFLRPQWKMVARKWRVQAAYDYAKICSAIYAGVKSTRLPARRSPAAPRARGATTHRAARVRRPRRSSSCPGSAARA